MCPSCVRLVFTVEYDADLLRGKRRHLADAQAATIRPIVHERNDIPE